MRSHLKKTNSRISMTHKISTMKMMKMGANVAMKMRMKRAANMTSRDLTPIP